MEFPAGEHVGWCARASLRISRAVLACASEGRRTLLGRRIRELLSHQLRFVWAASRYQGGVQRGAWSRYGRVARQPPRTAGGRLWNRLFVPLPYFCIRECEGGVMGKAQPLSLLREPDLAHQC